ncbi:MAG: VOC family protein [Sphingomonadales bacterium]|nr:VOC family protein [Sphingomonadales bacterium]
MIGSDDPIRSRAFYDAVFAAFGGIVETDYPGIATCYRFRNETRAWVARPFDGNAALPGNGGMPGFRCADEAEVDAAHAAAMANGGSDEGAPGPRPDYGPEFYGAYVRDPNGNKMSFICTRAAGR